MIRTGANLLQWRGVLHARRNGRPAVCEGVAAEALEFPGGTFTVLRGEDAAERHALFRVAGLFEAPAAGEVILDGENTRSWSEERRAEFRARRVGCVLSAPFLLPALTVAENIAMPIFRLTSATPVEAGGRAEDLILFAGLATHAQAPAGELGLEDQYAVAIARALAHDPSLLLVEELDASLEGEGLRRVTTLLWEAARRWSLAVIATASPFFPAELAERVLDLAGHLSEGGAAGSPLPCP